MTTRTPDAAEIEALAKLIADERFYDVSANVCLEIAGIVLAEGYRLSRPVEVTDAQALNWTWRHFHHAAEKLAGDDDMQRALYKFRDFWGLDCYTPPEDVMENVRNLVNAFLAAALGDRDDG